jgi:hypothetical protein
LREIIEGRFGDPAFGVLTAFAGPDQSSPRKFLEMMRDSWLSNAQPLTQFAHAKAGAVLGVTTMSLATTRQAQKNRQPVRMCQRLESDPGFLNVHISIIIDISYHVKAKFDFSARYRLQRGLGAVEPDRLALALELGHVGRVIDDFLEAFSRLGVFLFLDQQLGELHARARITIQR